MSHTPKDSHFVQSPDISLLHHRPHKTAYLIFQAITATALFQIWPTLLFMGAWPTMVVLINKKTEAEMTVPSTMLTVLGVLLGLTLSYRTSSAYDRYWEGRRMWSQIILACRTWGRIVWIHCPDSTSATAIEDPQDRVRDEIRSILEKRTMVQMAYAFSVAVKHYLRGEEGIFYEDLYDVVRFIPSLNLPSGIPSAPDANISSGPPHARHILRQTSSHSSHQSNGTSTPLTDLDPKLPTSTSTPTSASNSRPALHPSREPPKFRWSDTPPISYLLPKSKQLKAQGRAAHKSRMKSQRQGGGVGHNVPLEITLFMSAWIATMQKRKTIDVPSINSLLAALASMSEALSNLERILTTPIPWSYNAHIWMMVYVYCVLLPFQLYGSGFGWITIPAVVITAYIVVGFAAIGAEIENPFGYDANDLNLDFFVENIIKQELNAITARPFPPPEDWVFTAENCLMGVGMDKVQQMGVEGVRQGLRRLGEGQGSMRLRARSPEESIEVV